jgi:hypothetical protein
VVTRFYEGTRSSHPSSYSLQPLNQLDPYIKDKQKLIVLESGKVKPPCIEPNRIINISLQRVVQVLNLHARKWRIMKLGLGLTVSMITMMDEKPSRKPYPMPWKDQSILFAELPAHLQTIALFKVNTGCREQEVCKLRWDWEIAVPKLGASVLLTPANSGGRHDKTGVTEEDRKVLLSYKNGSITSHYSSVELGHLMEVANKVSATDSRGPALTVLRRMSG